MSSIYLSSSILSRSISTYFSPYSGVGSFFSSNYSSGITRESAMSFMGGFSYGSTTSITARSFDVASSNAARSLGSFNGMVANMCASADRVCGDIIKAIMSAPTGSMGGGGGGANRLANVGIEPYRDPRGELPNPYQAAVQQASHQASPTTPDASATGANGAAGTQQTGDAATTDESKMNPQQLLEKKGYAPEDAKKIIAKLKEAGKSDETAQNKAIREENIPARNDKNWKEAFAKWYATHIGKVADPTMFAKNAVSEPQVRSSRLVKHSADLGDTTLNKGTGESNPIALGRVPEHLRGLIKSALGTGVTDTDKVIIKVQNGKLSVKKDGATTFTEVKGIRKAEVTRPSGKVVISYQTIQTRTTARAITLDATSKTVDGHLEFQRTDNSKTEYYYDKTKNQWLLKSGEKYIPAPGLKFGGFKIEKKGDKTVATIYNGTPSWTAKPTQPPADVAGYLGYLDKQYTPNKAAWDVLQVNASVVKASGSAGGGRRKVRRRARPRPQQKKLASAKKTVTLAPTPTPAPQGTNTVDALLKASTVDDKKIVLINMLTTKYSINANVATDIVHKISTAFLKITGYSNTDDRIWRAIGYLTLNFKGLSGAQLDKAIAKAASSFPTVAEYKGKIKGWRDSITTQTPSSTPPPAVLPKAGDSATPKTPGAGAFSGGIKKVPGSGALSGKEPKKPGQGAGLTDGKPLQLDSNIGVGVP